MCLPETWVINENPYLLLIPEVYKMQAITIVFGYLKITKQ